jgi:hypothetical protein
MSGWMEKQSEEARERLRVVLTRARDRADAAHGRYQKLAPPWDCIPVGGAHIDEYVEYTAFSRFLWAIEAGEDPEGAYKAAKADVALVVENWNKRREWQVHRREDTMDSKLWDLRRQVQQAGDKEASGG